ncbi:MAG: DJ-1/PfpI family protein [Actinomycetota bacterium]|nr:DJ-1/PfpI family protein [Actinomycetota bacterium]
MTTIDVLFFDGCEALDAIGPLEILSYGGLDARPVVQGGPRLVRTAQGLEVQAGAPRQNAEWLIMPGGGWDDRASNCAQATVLGDLARAHAHRGGKLGAVCTGALWLADAGLVGSRPATTHHQYWNELAAMGAEVRRGERVVDDGDLVTSGGVTSGMFLGLHLVARIQGAAARKHVEAEIELPEIPAA